MGQEELAELGFSWQSDPLAPDVGYVCDAGAGWESTACSSLSQLPLLPQGGLITAWTHSRRGLGQILPFVQGWWGWSCKVLGGTFRLGEFSPLSICFHFI